MLRSLVTRRVHTAQRPISFACVLCVLLTPADLPADLHGPSMNTWEMLRTQPLRRAAVAALCG